MKEISLNFGAIRESILNVASNEILQENFKKGTLAKFKKSLQENSVLKKQYLVFKNFEECKPFAKEALAERFINQNMKLFKNEKWDAILKENKNIRIDILGDAHVEASAKNSELFENVHNLIEANTKSDFFNVIKEQESYDFLVKFLTREVIEEEVKSTEKAENPEFGWDFVTKIAVSNFNKRYTHLNESEKELLGMLLSTPDNKKNHILDLKEEVSKALKTATDGTTDEEGKIIFESFKEKIEKLNNLEESKIDDALIDLTSFREVLKEFITNLGSEKK